MPCGKKWMEMAVPAEAKSNFKLILTQTVYKKYVATNVVKGHAV